MAHNIADRDRNNDRSPAVSKEEKELCCSRTRSRYFPSLGGGDDSGVTVSKPSLVPGSKVDSPEYNGQIDGCTTFTGSISTIATAKSITTAKRERSLSPPLGNEELEEDEGLDTDTKIAILSSLFSDVELEMVLEILVRNGGVLGRARRELEGGVIQKGMGGEKGNDRKRVKTANVGRAGKEVKGSGSQGGIASTGGFKVITQQTSLPSFLLNQNGLSYGNIGAGPASLPKPRKGHPLLLFSPEQISALTPTTLITTFLSTDVANTLLTELIKEAESFPKKQDMRFNLFENKQVYSRHTNGFFVRSDDNGRRDMKEWYEAGYLYNGIAAEKGKVRRFTETMEIVTDLVEKAVQDVTRERWRKNATSIAAAANTNELAPFDIMKGKKKFESPEPWTTNAAFVNCYDGGSENVGWHTDQLTYLGPMSTIASLSLGVGREFGVKKVSGSGGDENGSGTADDGEGGVIKIWLPHNSLLIMEAGMQEEWKHWYVHLSWIIPS